MKIECPWSSSSSSSLVSRPFFFSRQGHSHGKRGVTLCVILLSWLSKFSSWSMPVSSGLASVLSFFPDQPHSVRKRTTPGLRREQTRQKSGRYVKEVEGLIEDP
jgi:hypothetical protein